MFASFYPDGLIIILFVASMALAAASTAFYKAARDMQKNSEMLEHLRFHLEFVGNHKNED